MKKIYTLLACLLFFTTTSLFADSWEVKPSLISGPKSGSQFPSLLKGIQKMSAVKRSPARAEGEDPTAYEGLKATEAAGWYYGDLAGNGTSCYFLFLSNAGISEKGAPTAPGQFIRFPFFAENAAAGSELVLPTGKYSFDANSGYDAGSILTSNVSFIDAFWNPTVANPTADDLVGYIYNAADKGQVDITKDADGKYTISVDMNLANISEDGDTLDKKHVTMTYTGAVTCTDHDPAKYTPVSGDYKLNIPNASGRYENAVEFGYGNYSIAFYSVALNGEGYIVGPGDLFNVELLVDAAEEGDLSKIAGTYTCAPFDGGVFTPGHFVGGKWYEAMAGYYIPAGTALTVYTGEGDNLVDSAYGLASDGTITVTNKGKGIYRFDIDYTTPESAHVTGSWEGELAKYIQGATDGISNIANGTAGRVYAADGEIRVENPAGGLVSVYAADGREVAKATGVNTGIKVASKGLYVVRTQGQTTKVLVK